MRSLAQFPMEVPDPNTDARPLEAAREWLDHVEARRIGGEVPLRADLMLALLRNEEVLLGRARSFSFGNVEAYRRRGR